MGKMKDLHAIRYEHTHYSRIDGSPAMMVSADPFTLMNEDGYEWQDDPGDWSTSEAEAFAGIEQIAVDISDVFADAVLVPVTEVRAGDYVFDTYGGRHRVERAEWSHGGDMVTIKRADWRAEHFWPDSTITIIRGER